MLVKRVIDGKVIETELTQEEIDAQKNQNKPEEITIEERVSAIEEVILNLL
jgi:hypothetical protein